MGPGRTISTRLPAVDALRGVAALSVVVFHCWLYSSANPDRPTRGTTADYVLFEARIGLILFFVLSGFLLYAPYARAIAGRRPLPSLRRYAARRVARIVPAYYFALAGAVVLVAAASSTPGSRPVSAGHLPLFLVFGQNYSGDTIMRLDPVTWTLCVEAAYYAFMPLFAYTVQRVARSARCAEPLAVAALVGVGIVWAHGAYAGHASLIVVKALPAFVPYFAVGMACAVALERRGRELSPRRSAATAAAGLGLVAVNAWWHASGAAAGASWLGTLTDLPAAIGFGLLVIGCVTTAWNARLAAAIRPLAAVGLVSYGLYLWHVPLLLALRGLGVLPSETIGAFAVVMPVVLVLATLSWVFVERPALRRAAVRR